MKLSEMAGALGWQSLWDGWDDRDVTGGYTSDLLSDVMARSSEGEILITIQAHKNTVAVAVLKDLSAMLIASNRPIPDDMAAAARDEGMPLFVCGENQFTCSWRIHEQLAP